MYKKIRFASDTLERIDGNYKKKGSDVRVLELNPNDYEIDFIYEKGLNVEQIAKKHDADIAINFPFMYAGTTVIGKSIINGKLFTDDWDITKPRYGFGVIDGRPYIGQAQEGSKFFVKGNPLLLANTEVIVDERIKLEGTSKNITNGRNTRMGIGLMNGKIIIAFVDGWTKKDGYKWDAGMTLLEFGKAMQQYGCQIFNNGDGGGSPTFYIKGEGVVNALKEGNPRILHHAIIFKKKNETYNPFEDYRTTSPYGYRIHPITGKNEFHTGIDLVKTHKAPIYAFVPGEVIFAGEGLTGSGFGGYGNVVAVKDKNGHLHCYCHLDSVSVKKGQQVKQGDTVGRQGATGQVTGSHLHYEIRKTDKPYYGWIQDAENRCFEPRQYLIDYNKLPTNDTSKELPALTSRAKVRLEGIELPAYITSEGRTVVEVRSITEALNLDIAWNDKTKTTNLIRRG